MFFDNFFICWWHTVSRKQFGNVKRNSLYVDDILLAGNNLEMLEEPKVGCPFIETKYMR